MDPKHFYLSNHSNSLLDYSRLCLINVLGRISILTGHTAHLFSTLSAENEFSTLSAENEFAILVCLISVPERTLLDRVHDYYLDAYLLNNL